MSWDDLHDEVLVEFGSLIEHRFSMEDVARMNSAEKIFYDRWAAKELERLPAEIQEALRRLWPARQRRGLPAWPQCAGRYCQRPRTLDSVYCAHHYAIRRRAWVKHYEKRKRGMREKLAKERPGINHKFSIMAAVDGKIVEYDGYLHMNVYEDGRLGEVFVRLGKPGDQHAWIDHWAISTSFALQYGTPVDELFWKFVGTRFEPSGPTKNATIPRCSSLLDYIARVVLLHFGNEDSKRRLKLIIGGEE